MLSDNSHKAFINGKCFLTKINNKTSTHMLKIFTSLHINNRHKQRVDHMLH